MKKHKPHPKIMRVTATNSDPSRQVSHQERKSLTVINHITFQFFRETKTASSPTPADGVDNEWENWAAAHKQASLGDAA